MYHSYSTQHGEERKEVKELETHESDDPERNVPSVFDMLSRVLVACI